MSLRLASEAFENETCLVPGNKIWRQPSRIAQKVSRLVFSRVKVLSADDARRNLDYDYLRADNCQRELYIVPIPLRCYRKNFNTSNITSIISR